MALFKRHQQHKDVPYSEGCGGLMWDAWGGSAGINWAISKLKQIDKNKMENIDMKLYLYNTIAFSISMTEVELSLKNNFAFMHNSIYS